VNEPVEIKLQGTLRRSLISPHVFEGQVTFKEITIDTIRSYGSLQVWWSWVRDRWSGKAMETMLGFHNEEGILQVLGSIRLKSDLSEIAGFLQNVEGIYPELHLSFAAPATNSQQVWGILYDLSLGKLADHRGRTVEEALSQMNPYLRSVHEQSFLNGKLALYDSSMPGLILTYVSSSGQHWIREGGVHFVPRIDGDQSLTWEKKAWGRTRRSANDDFLRTYLGVINNSNITSVVGTTATSHSIDADIITWGDHRLWIITLAPNEPDIVKIAARSASGETVFEAAPE